MNKHVLKAVKIVGPIAKDLLKSNTPGIVELAKPANKKIKEIRRIDEKGNKLPKFDLDRLTKLFIKKKIIPA